MLKRRLAVLGAVAVVAVTGLAGSAMADGTPAPAKVICTTSDGKSIEAIPAPEHVMRHKAAARIQADGETTKLEDLPAPPGLKGEPLPAVKAEPVEIKDGGHAVPALPAHPADSGDGAASPVEPVRPLIPGEDAASRQDGRTVRVTCEKPEQRLGSLRE